MPAKPGLVRVPDDGAAIEVEVWDVPIEQFGSFVDGIPAPLAIGKLELADGSWVNGFVCEPVGVERATDITRFGGWRSFLQSPLRSRVPSARSGCARWDMARGEWPSSLVTCVFGDFSRGLCSASSWPVR